MSPPSFSPFPSLTPTLQSLRLTQVIPSTAGEVVQLKLVPAFHNDFTQRAHQRPSSSCHCYKSTASSSVLLSATHRRELRILCHAAGRLPPDLSVAPTSPNDHRDIHTLCVHFPRSLYCKERRFRPNVAAGKVQERCRIAFFCRPLSRK